MEQIERPPERLPKQKVKPYLDELVQWLNRFWEVSYRSGSSATRGIETGNYTGNDTTSQTVTTTDIPKFVLTWRRPEDNVGSALAIWMRSDQSTNQASIKHIGSGGHEGINNALIAIDTTTPGFRVDDAGSNDHPNKNGVVYHYLVLS